MRGGEEFWEQITVTSLLLRKSPLWGSLFSSAGGILPTITLALARVWPRDDSSEVEAQPIWGMVVGVTASQLR